MKTGPACILAVDDEPAILVLLRQVLEQEGHSVLEAATGQVGLGRARTEQPDLILLDINLPDISGFTICRELKGDAATSSIPVIFLTAAEEDDTELRSFGEGAADFLRKPISRARLCVRVENILQVSAAKEHLQLKADELAAANQRLKESLIIQEQVRRNLLQRDQVLCAVNCVAKSFLQTSHWQNIIDAVLGQLGQAANCDHVYLRIFADSQVKRQDFRWARKGYAPGRPSIDLLASWRWPTALLKAGQPLISGLDSSLPETMISTLAQHQIRSCLILPLYVDQRLHGCLGFDSLSRRSWDSSLVRAMMISADIIGAAMQRNFESGERLRLAAAISHFADCVLMTDEDGCIFYANPASGKVTGWQPEELAGLNLSEIQFEEPGRTNCAEMLDQARLHGEWRGAMRSRHKDDTLYDEAVTVVPVQGTQGQAGSFCIIKHDQTEKKRLEAIAEAANLMENVGFVFAGIRHELGNPLNSLKMALSVLRRQVGSLSPDKIKEFLDRAMGEIGRMEYLLYSLKNFNQLEEQQLVPVELAAFLERFQRLHEPELRQQGIQFDVIAVGAPIYGLIDERALHQVLLNLLANSIHALKKQKNPAMFMYLTRKRRNFIQLRFQDNGCGISPQTKKKLFTPFFTTRINGTGLGLTIVRKMLTAMNCTVSMDGRENEGAWLLITIPEAPAPEQSSQ
ncbi:histidine kinase [Candidatus Electronema halotolerans]